MVTSLLEYFDDEFVAKVPIHSCNYAVHVYNNCHYGFFSDTLNIKKLLQLN